MDDSFDPAKSRNPELVANTVETWLGNPFSRFMIKVISGKRENGEHRIEWIFKKFSGLINDSSDETIRDKFAYRVVEFFLEKGAEPFGITFEEIKDVMKDPVLRRALRNVLDGIAYFGVQRPQTTYAPFLVVWNLTKQCNLRCKHCYENAGPKPSPDELTTEEAKKVIDEFYDIGVVAIAFSGGEPLLRKDFFELAKYAADKDFYVSVATNGTLISKDVARELKESGVQYVEISLDGFEEEHDEFRGIKGTWRRTIQGIKNCVEVGLDTAVATTITKHNYKNIEKLIEFVEKELKANRFLAFNFVPTRRGKDIIEQDLEPEEREKIQKLLYSKLKSTDCRVQTLSTAPQYARIAIQDENGPAVFTHFTSQAAMNVKGKARTLGEFIGGCGAGRLYCGMEPNGDIVPCVFLPIKLGNIREQNFMDIWRNHPLLQKIRNRNEFKCNTCPYLYVCGGCRARAYAYFNDVQAPDPGCIHNKKYWDILKRGGDIKLYAYK
ncbi:MAG: radical SAM protein [Candidatus Aenigmarchaeota archaeon]|nr:radical SAM protein [Candidatus Aenigmarchaeota archaeon]